MIEGDEDAEEDEEGEEGAEPAGPPLVETYAGRVRFQVLPAFDENKEPHPDIAKWDFGKPRHGLVGLTPAGELVFKMPGHAYDREAMVEQIDAMLAR